MHIINCYATHVIHLQIVRDEAMDILILDDIGINIKISTSLHPILVIYELSYFRRKLTILQSVGHRSQRLYILSSICFHFHSNEIECFQTLSLCVLEQLCMQHIFTIFYRYKPACIQQKDRVIHIPVINVSSSIFIHL